MTITVYHKARAWKTVSNAVKVSRLWKRFAVCCIWLLCFWFGLSKQRLIFVSTSEIHIKFDAFDYVFLVFTVVWRLSWLSLVYISFLITCILVFSSNRYSYKCTNVALFVSFVIIHFPQILVWTRWTSAN